MRSWSVIRVAALLACSGCYLFHTAPDANDVSGAPGADRQRDLATPVLLPRGPLATLSVNTCSVHAFRAGQKFDPIDMVWVVDSSRSMADEQARIRQTINQFVSDVEARHFDVHLVMVTADNIVPAPLGTDKARYLFVQRAVGSHAPLEALVEELPKYRAFLRPNAALHFVVVTDDESSLSAGDFLDEMNASLKRPFVLHAIASPDVNGSPCVDQTAPPECANPRSCGASAIGRQYYALADVLGGQEISICIDDWRMVFGPLLEAVGRTEVPCIIDLPEPASADTLVTLQQPSAGTLTLNEVPNAEACGRGRSYYFVDHAADTQLALCPVACGSTTLADVELRIAVGCGLP